MAGQARVELSLHGRVQRVGFRMFVQAQARLLGCTGYARNDPTGHVEVVAEGDRGALEQLVSRLRQGPPGAQVSHAEVEWRESTGEFGHFQIRL